MKTVKEISDQIALLRKAIEKDGYKPVVDGTHLQEHLYYIRRGAIDHLIWVIENEAEKDEQEARALAEWEDELNRRDKMDELEREGIRSADRDIDQIENDLAEQEKKPGKTGINMGCPGRM